MIRGLLYTMVRPVCFPKRRETVKLLMGFLGKEQGHLEITNHGAYLSKKAFLSVLKG